MFVSVCAWLLLPGATHVISASLWTSMPVPYSTLSHVGAVGSLALHCGVPSHVCPSALYPSPRGRTVGCSGSTANMADVNILAHVPRCVHTFTLGGLASQIQLWHSFNSNRQRFFFSKPFYQLHFVLTARWVASPPTGTVILFHFSSSDECFYFKTSEVCLVERSESSVRDSFP